MLNAFMKVAAPSNEQ
jgi:hypothetical protein